MTVTAEHPVDVDLDAPAVGEPGVDAPSAGLEMSAVARWSWRAAAVVGLAALVVLLVTFVHRTGTVSSNNDQNAEQQNAISVASQEVVNLTTLSASTSEQDIKRLLALAAPSFQKQFETNESAFKSALSSEKVVSKGVVESAGLVSATSTKATVLVAASASVTNSSSKTPDARTYRLQVSLQRIKGQWLVADMSFVA